VLVGQADASSRLRAYEQQCRGSELKAAFCVTGRVEKTVDTHAREKQNWLVTGLGHARSGTQSSSFRCRAISATSNRRPHLRPAIAAWFVGQGEIARGAEQPFKSAAYPLCSDFSVRYVSVLNASIGRAEKTRSTRAEHRRLRRPSPDSLRSPFSRLKTAWSNCLQQSARSNDDLFRMRRPWNFAQAFGLATRLVQRGALNGPDLPSFPYSSLKKNCEASIQGQL